MKDLGIRKFWKYNRTISNTDLSCKNVQCLKGVLQRYDILMKLAEGVEKGYMVIFYVARYITSIGDYIKSLLCIENILILI